MQDNITEVIEKARNSVTLSENVVIIIVQKLKVLRFALKKWSNIYREVERGQRDIGSSWIQAFNRKEETCSLTFLERKSKEDYGKELHQIYNKEEVYWKPRAKVKWLFRGDNNTSFFHKSVELRWKYN